MPWAPTAWTPRARHPLAVIEVRNLGESLTGADNDIPAKRWPQKVAIALRDYLGAGIRARRQRGTRARSASQK